MKTKYKLKPWVVKTLFILVIIVILITLINFLNDNMEQHIETVSKKCAIDGYGIKIEYTTSGDKYYVCNK